MCESKQGGFSLASWFFFSPAYMKQKDNSHINAINTISINFMSQTPPKLFTVLKLQQVAYVEYEGK